MNDTEGRQRLGAAVIAARKRKHRTIEAARSAAGISRGAWEKVERGDNVRDYTLDAVEQALDWPAGRALAIIAGEDQGATDDAPTLAGLAAALERIQRELDEMRGPPPATPDTNGDTGS